MKRKEEDIEANTQKRSCLQSAFWKANVSVFFKKQFSTLVYLNYFLDLLYAVCKPHWMKRDEYYEDMMWCKSEEQMSPGEWNSIERKDSACSCCGDNFVSWV